MKFTAYEAGAIQPLVASSPLMSWLYAIFSVQATSNLIGVAEIAAGVHDRAAALVGERLRPRQPDGGRDFRRSRSPSCSRPRAGSRASAASPRSRSRPASSSSRTRCCSARRSGRSARRCATASSEQVPFGSRPARRASPAAAGSGRSRPWHVSLRDLQPAPLPSTRARSAPTAAAVPARLPRVVIVGAGFGGLAAAKALRRAPVQVTRDRPAQPSPVPAAALPGRDRRALARRHRAADPRASCAASATRACCSAGSPASTPQRARC